MDAMARKSGEKEQLPEGAPPLSVTASTACGARAASAIGTSRFIALVELDARLLDDAGVLRGFGRNESRELRRAVPDDIGALGRDALHHVRQLEHAQHFGVNLADDLF